MGEFRTVIIGVLMIVVCCSRAATISESFSTDPLAHGWKTFGDTNLFRWNATNENLEATWDSSRSSSFLHLPLGTIISKSDDFSLSFDLQLSDIAVGTSANKPDTFEIAIGFINSVNATNPNSFRGAGVSSMYGVRNVFEFDYFPAAGVIDPTFAPTVISSNNAILFSDNRLEMTTGDLFRISMIYSTSNQILKTSVTRNGLPFGAPPGNTLKDLPLVTHKDFRVDQLAIINYSDALQVGSMEHWGSILAHGVVDNLVVTVPDGPVDSFVGAKTNFTWRAMFATKTNWFYSLERSWDFLTWNAASQTYIGTGGTISLEDANASEAFWFYRVKATKP